MFDPDDIPRSFPDALNTVLLLAATSLALVLTARIWHHIHPEHRKPTGFLSTAFHIYPLRAPTQQQQTLPESAPETDQKDRKSTRSKERRRRGKDPFRDLLKGGKKSKALLKAIKAADHLSPPSADIPDLDSLPDDDSLSSSRSPSPELSRDASEPVPPVSAESDDGGMSNVPATPAESSVDIPDHCSSCADPPDPMTATENTTSIATVTGHASKDSPSSPPACADVRTPHPRDTLPDSTSASCAKFVRARTRLRVLRIDPTKSSLPSSATGDSVASPLSSLSAPALSTRLSTHPVDAPAPSTPTDSCRSAPSSPSRSPPNESGQGEASAQVQIASMRDALETARLREEQLRVAAEHANKERDELCWRWNEDANAWRMRESELQSQVNHLMRQLQAYAAVASFQAQQPSNQPSSGFSSPTSSHPHMSPHTSYHPLVSYPLPPVIQTQNSASAPAHVQALLASAPMLTSHPPGFGAHAPGGLYSGAGLGMSPLLWSGLGLCVPNRDTRHGGRRTSESSASGSSSRGRRRRRSAENVQSTSDESSLGDWDGVEDGSGDDEEDIFENNALADAILKRPESLRKLSSSVGKRTTNGGRPPMHGEDGEKTDTLKDPGMEKHVFVPPLVDTVAVRTATETLERR